MIKTPKRPVMFRWEEVVIPTFSPHSDVSLKNGESAAKPRVRSNWRSRSRETSGVDACQRIARTFASSAAGGVDLYIANISREIANEAQT
jgi:hypothetical protein